MIVVAALAFGLGQYRVAVVGDAFEYVGFAGAADAFHAGSEYVHAGVL